MYRLDREDFVKTPYISLWSTLGFQAGFINAFGFLACGRYVSHVTGFGTQVGMALGNKDLAFAVELLGIPVSFILGAFVSGLITSAQIEQHKKPRFDVVTLLLPIIIASLLLLGHLGVFGNFGEELLLARDFMLLFLLSFVCGMQNACFAVMTRGQIRTTHLTGISTDIGTDLARIWFGKLSVNELTLSRRVNFSRIATLVSFAAGSIVSVLVCKTFTYQALYVPLVTSIGVYFSVRLISKKLDRMFSASVLKMERPLAEDKVKDTKLVRM